MSATGSLEPPTPGTVAFTRATVVPFPADRGADVRTYLGLVDALLSDALTDLDQLWSHRPELSGPDRSPDVDILGRDDLPQLLAELSRAGGKRLRPVMTYLGWVAASGRRHGIGHPDVVRVGAALELLHLFALVHDDVMDESDSRRGHPTVHVRARELHRSVGATGAAQRFGESIAILLGDLAHAEADELAAELPAPMRRIWRELVVELVCGQRYDLTGSAAGRHDLPHARHVARSKSGAYTVERPLQLGAAAAGSSDEVARCLRTYGRALGEAFALRDDLLGIWGDPSRTGKPVGDDLLSAKPTVLLALARQRLTGPAAARLGRLTDGAASTDDVGLLLADLEEAGLRDEVEDLIDRHVDVACSALDADLLDPRGVAGLRRMAGEIAWRDR